MFARIILDTSDYDDNLDEASRNTESFAEKMKNGLSTAAKVGAAALTAAASGVAALTKSSIDQYAEYEQLVGGVDTLFKEASDTVQQYAANAFQTAGMSANEYMSTVTNFSASLIQSLGGDTAAAAELSNQAITDMADNANKMGTSFQSLQDAYRGFSRQNYTMLDNLALGYGGTQEEMQRLLDDAEKLSGVHYELGNFGDMIEAIHVVQTEMGITGTTAAEASETIQGSVSAASAAWKNLVTGIADENADLDTLINQFVESVGTAAGNIIPRITQILSGIGTAIQQLAPILSSEIPGLISSMLPSLISAGAQLLVGLVTGLVGALPELAASIPEIVMTIYNSIVSAGPQLMTAGAELLGMIANGIMTGVPQLANTAVTMMSSLGQYIRNNLPTLIQTGLEAVSSFTSSLRENAGLVISGALGLAQSLAQGLADSIPTIVQNVPTIVSNIANIINDNAPKLIAAAANMIATLAKGLVDAIPTIIENIPKIISAIVDTLMAFNWLNLGKTVVTGLSNGLKGAVSFVKESATSIVNTIKENISQLPAQMLTIGRNIVQGLINGITGMLSSLKDKALEIGSSIVSTVTDFLGINSPSKVFMSIGQYMMQGLAIGMENSAGEVMETVQDLIDEVTDRFNTLANAFTAKQDISDLEYQLWERTLGQGATEAEKYDMQLQMLQNQQSNQVGVVEAAAAAYRAVVEQYGENSAESLSYQKTLLEESLAYQDLVDQINEVIAAKQQLYNTNTATVSYADSTSGRATEAAINAVAGNTGNQDITLNANLVMPDGSKFATWQLPFLINAGRAAGTPIANPQVG